MGFKEMKMMKSTEPSVDEVGKGMKSGGKPKMVMGGAPMGKSPMGGALSSIAAQNARKRPASAAEMATKRPRGAALMRSAAMSRPAPGIPAQAMGRVKNGGSMKKVDKEIRNEKEELHRVDERLNRHEAKAASKAHKGLKTGGIAGYATGGGLGAEGMKGQLGSSPTQKDMEMMKEARLQREFDKLPLENARNMKRLGPSPSKKDMEMIKEAMPKRKGGIAKYATGGIIQKFATGGVVNGAAGYKDGGFAKVACKDGGGFKAMKKGNC